jgi:hypothetical protein
LFHLGEISERKRERVILPLYFYIKKRKRRRFCCASSHRHTPIFFKYNFNEKLNHLLITNRISFFPKPIHLWRHWFCHATGIFCRRRFPPRNVRYISRRPYSTSSGCFGVCVGSVGGSVSVFAMSGIRKCRHMDDPNFHDRLLRAISKADDIRDDYVNNNKTIST